MIQNCGYPELYTARFSVKNHPLFTGSGLEFNETFYGSTLDMVLAILPTALI